MALSRSDVIKINKKHRQNDDSHLWPINNRFNVANRAIRQARPTITKDGKSISPKGYDLLLNWIESEIVNNPKNW